MQELDDEARAGRIHALQVPVLPAGAEHDERDPSQTVDKIATLSQASCKHTISIYLVHQSLYFVIKLI
jgi:hypothetical protein